MMGAPMKAPAVQGWHSELAEAQERGVSLQHLRRQRKMGIGSPGVKSGRRWFYANGSFAEYLEAKRKAEAAERERPPTRGRRPARPSLTV
jgi:hypothetical protein